jgi:hypothetical protein
MQRQGGKQVNGGLAVHGAKPMVKNTMAMQNRTEAVKSKMALNIGGLLGWSNQYTAKVLINGYEFDAGAGSS